MLVGDFQNAECQQEMGIEQSFGQNQPQGSGLKITGKIPEAVSRS